MASDIVAIDVHVHLSDEFTQKAKGSRTAQMAKYFGRERPPVSIDEMADQYRARKMMAVIMNTRDETVTGLTPVPNDHVAGAVKKHPDVFLAFGAIDPWTGKLALDEIKRCKDLGLSGIGELNPARQHFFANDVRFYPLWEECAKLGLPILFHGGMAAAGAGTPGGMGIKLKYSQPIAIDEVAADFPELKIISAHPTWPWTAESLAIARHKANYYIDLSGWAPKYFPRNSSTTSTPCSRTKRCSARTGRPLAWSAGWRNSSRSTSNLKCARKSCWITPRSFSVWNSKKRPSNFCFRQFLIIPLTLDPLPQGGGTGEGKSIERRIRATESRR